MTTEAGRAAVTEAYALGDYHFDVDDFFPVELLAAVTEVRVSQPHIIEAEAQARRRRLKLTTDGRLTILAADHPARMVTKVGDDALVMGNRQEYLGRILRVVTSDQIDGVMGTPDIIEELLIVNHLARRVGKPAFMDEKVILGCMNRGGLADAVFEMNDTFTAFSAERIVELGIDGAKIMFRLDLSNPESGDTVLYCAQAATECAQYGIPCFIEALPVHQVEGAYKVKNTAEDMIRVIGVAAALGETSQGTWLKLPYVEGYDRVAKATTCPILMLGGPSKGDPTYTIEEFAAGMHAGPNVRGALVGRNVAFPGPDDPRAVAGAIHKIVHDKCDAVTACKHLASIRGQEMDALADLT